MNLLQKICFFMIFVFPTTLFSQELSLAQLNFTINNLWLLVCTFLVFIMHLGFSCLESGLTRSKNTISVLFKNLLVVAIGILSYALVGFSLMYPETSWIKEKWMGFAGWGLITFEGGSGLTNYVDGNYSFFTGFIFQAMLAATTTTIISGAVAERIKLGRFLWFSLVFVSLVYPVLGSWKWGGGWLDEIKFYDFAGSTLVHSVGGWGALAGILFLGPRLGKYVNGKAQAIPGHNLPLASIGGLLLWFGWFGFNGGSVLSANPQKISMVVTGTALAASAGIIGAFLTSTFLQKKPDLTMTLNGCLAGLVSITAGADTIGVVSSIIVGFIGGILVVTSVIFIDTKLKLDDPVGAVSVHLVCGIWGTLAVGLFSLNPEHNFPVQFVGVMAYGLPSFLGSLIIFTLLSLKGGIRVAPHQELMGLDLEEHGMEAYPFQNFTNK